MVLYGLSSISCLIAVVIAIGDYRITLALLMILLVIILMLAVYGKRTDKEPDKKIDTKTSK